MISPTLTWNEALSGISGSISLAAWIFLLVPQLIENYRQGSADGISLTFLLIWMLGDITNLIGAVWAGLVPTVIALAVYFCCADTVLILQCLYYNSVQDTRTAKEIEQAERNEEAEHEESQTNGHTIAFPLPTEQTPLIAQNGSAGAGGTSPAVKRRLTDVTDENLGLPGSRRRSSHRTLETHQDSLSRVLEEPTRARAWLKNTISVIMILVIGTAGWAVAWRSGVWEPVPVDGNGESSPTPLGAEILGYASAVLYLGARIPQIIKNQRERSCEGLSLLFFMLSLLGNATYGAGILFHSVEREYFLTNLPWLIGSLGTMAEDAIIFLQFSAFGEKSEEAAIS